MALDHRVRGVDHAAFPTFDPVGTVRFYRDILGFPVAHAICAKGWGPKDHPDFIHFFFDIGDGDRIAFFYYFGMAQPHERGQGDAFSHIAPETPLYFARSRHLAIHVKSEADLLEYKRRLDASEYPCEMLVQHETIESIYVHDPNGYFVEVTRPMRDVEAHEVKDAELTIDALLATIKAGDASLPGVWREKAKLIEQDRTSDATTLLVLDVPEFAPVAEVASKDADTKVERVGKFFEITKKGPIVVDRRATGLRHACWYSAVAGVRGGRVTQYDKDALRVEPV